MAPKKKPAKKGVDDWENELGETADGTSQALQQGEDAPGADASEENASGGFGGLMAALKKNKDRKSKRGKATEDFVLGEDPPGMEDGTPEQANAAKSTEKANSGDPVTTKRGKETENDDGDDEKGLMSKKEKEKLKKEKEKQRKKENAAKKRTAAPPLTAAKTAPAKTEVEAVAEPTAPITTNDAAPKKKKLPAALAALQKQQEQLRRKQEEEAQIQEANRALIEEEERQAAEKERKREEAKLLKKQKEKEKKEQLKREGKFMTKNEMEAAARRELRLKQMIAAGGKVVGLEEGTSEKKKPVYGNKKKRGKKDVGDPKPDEIDVAESEISPKDGEEFSPTGEEPEADIPEEEKIGEVDDWEAEADKIDGVKESWDADTDEEDEARRVTLQLRAANQAEQQKLANQQKEQNSDSDSDGSAVDEVTSAAQRAIALKKEEAAERRRKQHEEALAARSKDNLRSPICCILGHVDTGKTKLLDKIRQTNVQEGEAGGITQQIGATYFPVDAIKTKTQVVNKDGSFDFKVPGLLVIDTPGHESFSNLRSRGSSLCNIAILVVDIMHGLEPQTLESMKLLRDRKTPFIVALNKIDRLYNWSKINDNGFQESLAAQKKSVQNEFQDRLDKTKLAFSEQGFNAELFYQNKSMARNVSLVPTSAHTGEGIPDMLKLLVQLTQERMTNKLMYLSEVECTVLEVKIIEGLGTTIDVILSNGVLKEGDRIVLCGSDGPISTNIRALLTPAPMRELRLKSQYVHNKEVKASLGVKIAANDLEHAIAGSRLLVVGPDDDEEELEEEVMSDLESLLSKVSKTGRGVTVQASTLGSLEALLEFLKTSNIPVATVSIGPVYKRDVMQAGTMLEKNKEYAVMLCFDVKIDKDAQTYADEVGVKIFSANIIYHLFDNFTKHMAELAEQKKEESKLLAVFPCVLTPVAVFNKKDPIIIGIDVTEGSLRLLTPIATVKTNPVTGVKEVITLGRVSSIERDHKQIPICKKGQPSVAVKIEGPNQPLYGRQLEEKDMLYSLISRQSIDTLKEFYRADVSNDEWLLIKKLKVLFDIP
ncbi:MAG: hypothetical protein M1829_002199 [Trizodia sp. TS-e1964]|nr:MAG: hypothetical protein M1829_002199 [Trizodia sp. TS-e1964]